MASVQNRLFTIAVPCVRPVLELETELASPTTDTGFITNWSSWLPSDCTCVSMTATMTGWHGSFGLESDRA